MNALFTRLSEGSCARYHSRCLLVGNVQAATACVFLSQGSRNSICYHAMLNMARQTWLWDKWLNRLETGCWGAANALLGRLFGCEGLPSDWATGLVWFWVHKAQGRW
jgi:hypothetical protein